MASYPAANACHAACRMHVTRKNHGEIMIGFHISTPGATQPGNFISLSRGERVAEGRRQVRGFCLLPSARSRHSSLITHHCVSKGQRVVPQGWRRRQVRFFCLLPSARSRHSSLITHHCFSKGQMVAEGRRQVRGFCLLPCARSRHSSLITHHCFSKVPCTPGTTSPIWSSLGPGLVGRGCHTTPLLFCSTG